MDPKYDSPFDTGSNDFEATHNNLMAYRHEGRKLDAHTLQVVWERQLMERVKELEGQVADLNALLTASPRRRADIERIADERIAPYGRMSTWVKTRKFIGVVFSKAALTATTVLVTAYLAMKGLKG